MSDPEDGGAGQAGQPVPDGAHTPAAPLFQAAAAAESALRSTAPAFRSDSASRRSSAPPATGLPLPNGRWSHRPARRWTNVGAWATQTPGAGRSRSNIRTALSTDRKARSVARQAEGRPSAWPSRPTTAAAAPSRACPSRSPHRHAPRSRSNPGWSRTHGTGSAGSRPGREAPDEPGLPAADPRHGQATPGIGNGVALPRYLVLLLGPHMSPLHAGTPCRSPLGAGR